MQPVTFSDMSWTRRLGLVLTLAAIFGMSWLTAYQAVALPEKEEPAASAVYVPERELDFSANDDHRGS